MGPSRRILLAVLLFLVAACSGGGCSSGCQSCGIDPLPNGFPKPETIPNAAAARVTRPGLTFLQENVATLATQALGAANVKNGVAAFTIPKSSQSGATVCPSNNPPPPECQAEIGLGTMKMRVNAITPNRVKLDGVVPVRVRDLPVSAFGFTMTVVAGDSAKAPDNDLCDGSIRGKDTFPYKEIPINVELPLVAETRPPREGYTKVDVKNAVIDFGITSNDVEFCDASFFGDIVKAFAFSSLKNGIVNQVRSALTGAFCTAPVKNVTPACPPGSEPNDADLAKATTCEFIGTDECVPSLLGADGHMDLGKVLASFSPGTTGGLDFILASSGNMTPHPSEATLPAWTPRKPPVVAEDNNQNGISLSLRGGALPQPKSNCVEEVRRDPPQDIPVPVELTGNSVTPWPANTPGPHFGFALAGRYLDHALLGAYNSGALCLGLNTDAVAQLNSGYLGVLAPSLRDFTFDQQNAAAGVVTRPGAPPKVTIGAASPLLTIALEKFSVDFMVWSFDRYVRIFTYTADVTVPVDIQTGKSEKNPNGGLLPVLGDIGIANAKVTNNLLVFEDDTRIRDGVSGLLGGIVGQFLGGGFSPFDIGSALASAGLSLEIPEGGIRKITSGKDDFLAVFANLAVAPPAAHAEVDTRAAIVEKIVDPTAMGLETAVRARFPKLRVRIDTDATKATEHTWWIDQGTHAKWTADRDIVVDADAMLLQGKHVLHVASRFVGDVASEDATPVDLPYVIDTLPPNVRVEDGKVDAWDFVSPVSALEMRERTAGGEWSEWSPLHDVVAATSAIEVRDEEGNVGSVSLALRGRVDPSIAAGGSGCGCHATGANGLGSNGLGSVALEALAALGAMLALGTRTRRRSSKTR